MFGNFCTRSLLIAAFIGVNASAFGQQPSPDAPLTTEEALRSGFLRVTVRDNAPPFAFRDASGQPSGFSWSLCAQVVKRLEKQIGRPLKIYVKFVNLQHSFETIKARQADLHCGSTTHTIEREKMVDFSYTFFVAGLRVAYRADAPAFADEKIMGRAIALPNSTALAIAKRRAEQLGPGGAASVDPVATYVEGVAKLKSGKADTFFADGVLIPVDDAIAVREKPLTVEPYALMMQKDQAGFSDSIDKLLIELLAERGQLLAIVNGLRGKVNTLTLDAWRRPSKAVAPSLY